MTMGVGGRVSRHVVDRAPHGTNLQQLTETGQIQALESLAQILVEVDSQASVGAAALLSAVRGVGGGHHGSVRHHLGLVPDGRCDLQEGGEGGFGGGRVVSCIDHGRQGEPASHQVEES